MSSPSRVLIIGCGSDKSRRIKVNHRIGWEGQEVVTIDHNPAHKPDSVWDLNSYPWCIGYRQIEDSSFDEVHAYEVLEHLGRQGEYRSFFDTFYEIWRVLKPGGHLAASVPKFDSIWAWGDPSHARVINQGSLAFLSRPNYETGVGTTSMSDFRDVWRGDFDVVTIQNFEHNMLFVLKAIKPIR